MLGQLALLVTLLSVNADYFGNVYCKDGRDVMTHLFEWPWASIEGHCSQLAAWGYCAVQVSPPQEHIQGSQWWTRYQPVSYKLSSRSGDRAAFENMVRTCNNAGVLIYVDAVVNHMTGGGSGYGTGGSYWNGGNNPTEEDYPSVPYGGFDFNDYGECSTGSGEIESYQDVNQVRNCRLVGLRDLRLGQAYVRGKIHDYLNDLVGIGVAGFRVDASKHMWPGDMQAILDGLHNLNTEWFPGGTRPFVFQEVIDKGGEPITAGEYTGIARVTEFKYGEKLGEVIRLNNGQKLMYLDNFGESWGFISGMDSVAFIDNHDNQRGHGGGTGNIITHTDPRNYKIASAYMLAWSYGYIRVMSSFAFSDSEHGPPGGAVTCFNGQWVCEHAWRQIYNMVGFHNAVTHPTYQSVTNWWDNGNNAIAFSRGNKGWIGINKEGNDVNEWFNTGLPSGSYCDVITCDNNRPPCGNSGGSCRSEINVNSDGWAQITIPNDDDPVVAIHA